MRTGRLLAAAVVGMLLILHTGPLAQARDKREVPKPAQEENAKPRKPLAELTEKYAKALKELAAAREAVVSLEKELAELKRTWIRLGLAKDPLRLTIIQRQSKPIPGFYDRITVEIGDITVQQVLLTIREKDKDPLAGPVSLKVDDVVKFRFGGTQYFLSVIRLRNFLVGDDFGVFEISTKRPPPKKVPQPPGNQDRV